MIFDADDDLMPTEVGEENGDGTPTQSLENALLDTEVGMESSTSRKSNSLLCINPSLLEDRGEGGTGYGSINGRATGRVKDDTVGEVEEESIPAGANGIRGLLAIPHVPMLLYLTAIASVRCGRSNTRKLVCYRRVRAYNGGRDTPRLEKHDQGSDHLCIELLSSLVALLVGSVQSSYFEDTKDITTCNQSPLAGSCRKTHHTPTRGTGRFSAVLAWCGLL